MTDTQKTTYTRRRVLAGLSTIGLGGLAGCLTLSPTVSADLSGSSIFESVSTGVPWARGNLPVSVTLAPEATTDSNVRGIFVADESGVDYESRAVTIGQTSETIYMPYDQRVTLGAVDYNGATVETVEVTVGDP
ncbi:hypothetical protein ACNS7O_04290 [Haloferacaceae archaeon DSL9]